MNYYPFHIGDYASTTRHLSWDEDMAYRRLIDSYYTRELPIPADKRAAYRLACATTDSHRAAVDVVLSEFFALDERGEWWVNQRCESEIRAATEKREKARASAMIGVQSREQKNAELRRLRMKDAKERGSHTNEEWAALVALCRDSCVRCGSTESIKKDHITPIYQGGDDSIDNLQPLCCTCNSAKGPESTDHRPANWKESIQRSLSERSANAAELLSERLAPNPNPNPNPNISTDVDIKTIRAPRFDARAHLSSLGVPDQIAIDWIAHRRAKRATPTRTAIDGIAREADVAGLYLGDALGMCGERDWTGFKPDWLTPQQPPGRPQTVTETRTETVATLTGRIRHANQLEERDITPGLLRLAK